VTSSAGACVIIWWCLEDLVITEVVDADARPEM